MYRAREHSSIQKSCKAHDCDRYFCSYSEFAYSDLIIHSNKIDGDQDAISSNFTLHNVSDVTRKEIVQFYKYGNHVT